MHFKIKGPLIVTHNKKPTMKRIDKLADTVPYGVFFSSIHMYKTSYMQRVLCFNVHVFTRHFGLKHQLKVDNTEPQ